MRFEVKKEGETIKVWDSHLKNYITIALPSMEIANEIVDDFNKMENKDYTPLGLPNFSNKK